MTSSVRLRGGSMEEIEIKFAVKDTKNITEKLGKLGFGVTVGRHLEKNYLLDDHDGNLQKAGTVLRIRKTPSGRTLTYKGPISAASKLKHREEIECRIEDADILLRIFEESGFNIRTEYSKYRTILEKNGFKAFLDETQAAHYLEDEGPSDESITKVPQRSGN